MIVGKSSEKGSGQSLVEFSLVLPFLLLLLLGMVDVGYAFYDYIVLTAANREGVRLASRGRFDNHAVASRIVSSGGMEEVEGSMENRFRTDGPDSNFGMIMTHFPIDENGNLEMSNVTKYLTGTIQIEDEIRYITADDSRIEGDYEGFHGDITRKINTRREAAGYDAQHNEIVVIETFFAHETFFPTFLDLLQIPKPLTLYSSGSMRVLRDSRID